MLRLVAVLVLAAATSAPSAPSSGAGSGAEIVDSGSTNTEGYVLRVERSGGATVQPQGTEAARRVTIAPSLADRFFAALDAAAPLASLPTGRCMKSASFGTTLRVRYLGGATPDLTCPANDQVTNLASLAREIVRAARIPDVSFRRRPFFVRVPSPSPS